MEFFRTFLKETEHTAPASFQFRLLRAICFYFDIIKNNKKGFLFFDKKNQRE